jgi:hypothetical protein
LDNKLAAVCTTLASLDILLSIGIAQSQEASQAISRHAAVSPSQNPDALSGILGRPFASYGTFGKATLSCADVQVVAGKVPNKFLIAPTVKSYNLTEVTADITFDEATPFVAELAEPYGNPTLAQEGDLTVGSVDHIYKHPGTYDIAVGFEGSGPSTPNLFAFCDKTITVAN